MSNMIDVQKKKQSDKTATLKQSRVGKKKNKLEEIPNPNQQK